VAAGLHSGSPGASSDARFRELRRSAIRRYWRDLAILAALGAGAAIWIVLGNGFSQLLAAWLLGAVTTIALIGWLIGFDVQSLSWAWGAIGERQTAEALEALDSTWHVVHDLPRAHANWDHIVVGEAGVFLLDSKRMMRTCRVKGEALVSGRTCFPASRFRYDAFALSSALERVTQVRPWVQSVVVIWGDFPQRQVETDRVVYVGGSELTNWLREQKPKLSNDRVLRLANGLNELAQSAPPSAEAVA
jgi:nuclease-like protein